MNCYSRSTTMQASKPAARSELDRLGRTEQSDSSARNDAMTPRNRTRDSIKQSEARVPYRAQEIRTAAREEVEGEAAGWSGGGAGGKARVPAGSRTGGFRKTSKINAKKNNTPEEDRK
ncbi:hypothetical protein PAHAL_9G227500 [Panicum hallii]|uniref:Uncharacterized protein n=1 Tax=Panicum hallii TaxID=206008 RepID=A0A2S3ILK8_9POAL|nr:hypothetical protein PAHAL_9G227500 [Panicum hallii]